MVVRPAGLEWAGPWFVFFDPRILSRFLVPDYNHGFRHELRKEGSMQILQLKCLNEKCQLKVKDEWEKTENAKNQLNNKRQSHQERFNSS